tara:strand:- start:461 stop:694 length:234 start_codon:yes stop_codon:yes gene_type:complete
LLIHGEVSHIKLFESKGKYSPKKTKTRYCLIPRIYFPPRYIGSEFIEEFYLMSFGISDIGIKKTWYPGQDSNLWPTA